MAGGKAGRGSENKVPFVAAISLGAEGRPLYIKMALVPGFTCKAVFDWATADLAPDCIVTSDGLGCFAGVIDAGCNRRGRSQTQRITRIQLVNTVFGNLNISLGGAYHAFDFAKYGTRYSVRLFTVSTGASILKHSLCVCSSPQPLSGLARHVGFGKLKNLSNQVFVACVLPRNPAIPIRPIA